MGTGMCRRQKSLLHTGFCVLSVLALATGIFLYNYIVQKAKSSEALAMRNKQQQEALSAQLQVVYEHRSRLERSLQKEKSELKKTKEDFLVYKLEAQEALNKEKNQHDDLKKQLSDLQNEHSNLKMEHRKALETHSQRLSQLQRDKEKEMIGLQDTILKLREESKLLRKAHNDVHTQLRNAQTQMDEFLQLKDALKKMPSFKNPVPEIENLLLSSNKQFNEAQMPKNPLGNSRFMTDGPIPGAEIKRVSQEPLPKQDSAVFQNQRPSEGLTPRRSQNESISHVVRFARTVNSLQSLKKDANQQVILKAEEKQDTVLGNEFISDLPAVPGRESLMVKVMTGKEQVPIQSWQAIVNKVNARMTEDDIRFGASNAAAAKQEMGYANVAMDKWDKEAALPPSNKKADNNEELEMDAAMIDKDENLQSRKQHVVQEPLVPEDAADPAKDPNNQGEDEFEEAEVDRPEFNHKAASAEQQVQPLAAKVAHEAERSREEPEDHYQDDQEEEHGGELENAEDLDEDHKRADTQDIKSKRDDDY